MNTRVDVRRVLPGLLTGLLVVFAAHARDGARASAQMLPTYTQECTACHIAYPPGMLPSESWRRLTSTLDRHYGTDASIDTATAARLATWLAANAGTSRRVREAPPEDRITRSAWFARKHHEVAPSVWKRASVKSPSNCNACHAQKKARRTEGKQMTRSQWERFFRNGTHDRYLSLGGQMSLQDLAAAKAFLSARALDASADEGAGLR